MEKVKNLLKFQQLLVIKLIKFLISRDLVTKYEIYLDSGRFTLHMNNKSLVQNKIIAKLAFLNRKHWLKIGRKVSARRA